jgi:uncharacterized Zn-binding protein involved in type VI secretion
MPPAARLSDDHECPKGGGEILPPCEPTVLIGDLPAARLTDTLADVLGVDMIAEGSKTVMVGNLAAARIGDATAAGGVIVEGDMTVWIGDSSGVCSCLASAAAVGAAFISGIGSPDTAVA